MSRRLIYRLSYSALLMTALGCNSSTPQAEETEKGPAEIAQDTAEQRSVTLSKDAIQSAGIELGVAELRELRPTFRAPAAIGFNEEAFAHVGTPVPGRVVEIKVRLGDQVAAKDILLVVESPELGAAQSDYLQKRSMIAARESALSTAKLAFERGQSVFEQGQGIALAEVQKPEADYKQAESALATDVSAVRAAKQKLQTLGMDEESIGVLERYGRLNSRQHILAPISGTVVQREVTLGELVVPDKETLLMLADMTKLWVIADVPEQVLSSVKSGAKAWVNVSAVPDQTLEGEVTVISPSLNSMTRTAAVRIEVDTRHLVLKPGMFAEVEIEVDNAKHSQSTVVVPESAVQRVGSQDVVFTPSKSGPGVFSMRVVTTGDEVAGLLPIVHGLEPGERVAIRGTFVLKAELEKGQTEDDD